MSHDIISRSEGETSFVLQMWQTFLIFDSTAISREYNPQHEEKYLQM
jgi:hypothetical protein